MTCSSAGVGRPSRADRGERDALADALARDRVVAGGLELQAVELAAVGVAGLLALEGGDREVGEVHLVAAVVVLPFTFGWDRGRLLRIHGSIHTTFRPSWEGEVGVNL